MLMSAHVHVQMIHLVPPSYRWRPCDAMRCDAMPRHAMPRRPQPRPRPSHATSSRHAMPCSCHAGAVATRLAPLFEVEVELEPCGGRRRRCQLTSTPVQPSQPHSTQLKSTHASIMEAAISSPLSPTQLNSRLVGARLERGQHHGGGLGGAPRALHLALGVDELVEVDRS